MKQTVLFLCAGLALLSSVALAADVTGKWTGEMGGPGGGMTMTFHFKQDGTKLTGSVDGPGGDLQIKDGKVEGDTLSFNISFDGGAGDMKITHEGTIKGDQITLRIKMEGGPGEVPDGPMILQRVK